MDRRYDLRPAPGVFPSARRHQRVVLRTTTTLISFVLCIAAPCAALGPPPASPASGEQRKWEIEFHASASLPHVPTSGTASLPEPGVPFATLSGRPSRRVSSWYFGDGASLLNQVYSAPSIRVNERITPLDSVLQGALATPKRDAGFGFRIGRAINPRLTAEFNLEFVPGHLEIAGATLSGIEATRASFARMWTAILSNAAFVIPSASSTTTAHSRQGRVFTTGALSVNLKTEGRMMPYVTAGAGIISNVGSRPSVTLTGSYQFLLGERFLSTRAIR